jgi:hypothetical protein
MYKKFHKILEDEVKRGNPPVFPDDSVRDLRNNVEFIKNIMRAIYIPERVFFIDALLFVEALLELEHLTLEEAQEFVLKKQRCINPDFANLLTIDLFHNFSSRNDPETLRRFIYHLIEFEKNSPLFNDHLVPIQSVLYAHWIYRTTPKLVWRENRHRSGIEIERDIIPVPDTFIGTIRCRKATLMVLLIGKVNKRLPRDIWRLLAKYLYLTRREEVWFLKTKSRKRLKTE